MQTALSNAAAGFNVATLTQSQNTAAFCKFVGTDVDFQLQNLLARHSIVAVKLIETDDYVLVKLIAAAPQKVGGEVCCPYVSTVSSLFCNVVDELRAAIALANGDRQQKFELDGILGTYVVHGLGDYKVQQAARGSIFGGERSTTPYDSRNLTHMYITNAILGVANEGTEGTKTACTLKMLMQGDADGQTITTF